MGAYFVAAFSLASPSCYLMLFDASLAHLAPMSIELERSPSMLPRRNKKRGSGNLPEPLRDNE
jgi:hypothetical protein